jgi:hypothetical protein
MSKGSRQRRAHVSHDEFSQNWDAVFGAQEKGKPHCARERDEPPVRVDGKRPRKA